MINIAVIIIFGVLILVLMCTLALFIKQQVRYEKWVDSLLDRLMSRNYTDYKIGQGIKADEQVEKLPTRTDAEEAKIEEDRNKGLLKTAHILGGDIENMGL